MQVFKKSVLLLLSVSALLGACKKDEQDVAPTDDNEAITTATLRLTNTTNPADTVSATVENLNTQADFSKATLNLKANTTYSAVIQLWDKTQKPTVDATEEIREKKNEHLFVYTPASGLNLTVNITDQDSNPAPGPYPVGLTSTMTTGAASSGQLNVVLRHQPGAKNGTATPGTSDLDTRFSVVIQ